MSNRDFHGCAAPPNIFYEERDDAETILLFRGDLDVGIAPMTAAQSASMEDEKAVRDAVNQWFVVLNAMLNGDPAPFAAIYSHADDVSYLGAEGGIHTGWDATYADWKLPAEKAQGGNVEGADIHIVVVGDMAIAQHFTNGEGHGSQRTTAGFVLA